MSYHEDTGLPSFHAAITNESGLPINEEILEYTEWGWNLNYEQAEEFMAIAGSDKLFIIAVAESRLGD